MKALEVVSGNSVRPVFVTVAQPLSTRAAEQARKALMVIERT
jgi:hypothetical protein